MTQKSKVFFASMKLSSATDSLPKKLRRLLMTAGINTIDFEKKFTAIKMHFGESGNLAYLRPDYARVLADLVKELGGRPFLCDCNTLYAGRRKNALEHLELAYEHGFSPFSTGCHVLIGDGLDGSNEAIVPVENGVYIKEAKIGRAIMDADVYIALSHFKGHIETGFGGAIKNTGMGCGSRSGKMEMHSASAPEIKSESCIVCRKCARFCASDAISYRGESATIDYSKCVACGYCIAACPVDAIRPKWDEKCEVLNAKIAEYTKAIVSNRPSFFISFAVDISPLCDCFGSNDIPIVPDIGMFASFDPVAIDMACADAVNNQAPMPDSTLAERLAEPPDQSEREHAQQAGAGGAHPDHFTVVNPASKWRSQIDHAVSIGLGSADYELVQVE